jgi:hypothetical protein
MGSKTIPWLRRTPDRQGQRVEAEGQTVSGPIARWALGLYSRLVVIAVNQ